MLMLDFSLLEIIIELYINWGKNNLRLNWHLNGSKLRGL